MEAYFRQFDEIVRDLKARRRLSERVKLLIHGRLSYAVERGDVTIAEAERIKALLGGDRIRGYARDLELATFGNAEDDLVAKTA